MEKELEAGARMPRRAEEAFQPAANDPDADVVAFARAAEELRGGRARRRARVRLRGRSFACAFVRARGRSRARSFARAFFRARAFARTCMQTLCMHNQWEEKIHI